MTPDFTVKLTPEQASACVPYLQLRREHLIAKFEVNREGIMRDFFELKVNHWFSKLCDMRFFDVDRERSDELFEFLYNRVDGKTWPLWATPSFYSISGLIDRHERAIKVIDTFISTFRGGVTVFVADHPYTGILQLDKFFEDAEKHDRLHD